MKVSILSFTRKGASLNKRLKELLRYESIEAESYGSSKKQGKEDLQQEKKDLLQRKESLQEVSDFKKLVEGLFVEQEAIIFIGAAGIAVRLIAPYFKGKEKDPAVLVIDEGGNFVISLLSGHIGGANALCKQVAELLKATPVITTATDVRGKFAVDTWAVENNLWITDISMIKVISSKILNGEKIGIYSDYKIEGSLPLELTPGKADTGICITRMGDFNPFPQTLKLVPRNLVAGMGCKKDTSYEQLKASLITAVESINRDIESICKICSIDIKEKEPGLIELSKAYKIPFCTFTAGELKRLEGDFSASSFVEKTTGVDNVCERSAFLGSGYGKCLVKKQSMEGVTVAIYEQEYTVRFD